MSTPKLKKHVLRILTERPLSLKELAEKMGLTEKRTYNLLRALFQEGKIKSFAEAGNRRYAIDEKYQEGEEGEEEEEVEPN